MILIVFEEKSEKIQFIGDNNTKFSNLFNCKMIAEPKHILHENDNKQNNDNDNDNVNNNNDNNDKEHQEQKMDEEQEEKKLNLLNEIANNKKHNKEENINGRFYFV